MLYNFGTLITKCQQWLGYPVLDETTDIPLSFLKDAINQSMRETMSEFNYRLAESPILVPFLHTIHNTQGAFLTGTSTFPVAGSGITATILPFPTTNGANGYLVNDTVVNTYSGLTFVGTDGAGTQYTGISTSGNKVLQDWNNVIGYQYELPEKIEQIYGITIPQNSIKLAYCPQYDFDRGIPQGTTIASGTPYQYTSFPGLSPSGNLTIQFYPQPTVTPFSGQTFQIHYKRKHEDMVALTDQQSLFPSQFQDIIIEATLEKCYAFLSDEKSVYHGKRKLARMEAFETFCENNLDYVYVARDADFLSSPNISAYNTSILFRI